MDLRLAGLVLGIWAGVLLALVLHNLWWLNLLILGLLLWFGRRGLSGRFVLVLIATAAGVAIATIRLTGVDAFATAMQTQTQVTGQATLLTDVTCYEQRNQLDWQTNQRARAIAQINEIEISQGLLKANAVVSLWFAACPDRIDLLSPGTQIRFHANWQSKQSGFHAGAFALKNFEIVQATSWLQRGSAAVRTDLRETMQRSWPQSGAQLMPGLVLGDTSLLSPKLIAQMQTSGLTHLVAVSGANVTLLLTSLHWLLRRFMVSKILKFVTSSAVLFAFVTLVRAEPSVLRASIMGLIGLIAITASVPKFGLPALFIGASFLLLWYPWLAISWGFALSFFATLGILLWAGQFTSARWLSRIPIPIRAVIAVTIAAQLGVFALLISLGSPISLLSIFANVMAAPFASWVMVAGLAFTLLNSIAPSLALLLSPLVVWPATLITQIAQISSGLTQFANLFLPWPSGPLGISLAVFILIGSIMCRISSVVRSWVSNSQGLILGICLSSLLWQPLNLPINTWPAANWAMVACDVGQGDSTVLRTGPTSAVLIDVGGQSELVDRCLDQLGIEEIELLVLTHFHADHVGGIAGVFPGRRVVRVAATSYHEPQTTVAFVVEQIAQHGLILETLNYPTKQIFGQLTLTCLWPDRNYEPSLSPVNNSSLALLAQIDGRQILLPGDLEPIAQSATLAKWAAGKVDVLKIAHHGSRYQALDFAKTLAPTIATISVGKDNDYGHPAPETLALYQLLGTRILRTDQQGSIAISLSPLAISVEKSSVRGTLVRWLKLHE